MRLIINWFINAAIIYFGATNLGLIEVDSFQTALLVSLVAAVLTFVIRLATIPLKAFGCFTFGLTYLAGIILSIFAIPLALYLVPEFLKGVRTISTTKTVILGIIISVANNLVMMTKRGD